MKKLSLLMFAILILGCGTETPVVEEPEPVIEEPPPVVMEDEPIGHPLVAKGTVKHGEMNVDPEPLNSTGFHFEFTEPFYRYWVQLWEKDGEYLAGWDSPAAGIWDRRNFLRIWHPVDYNLLEYDTEYEIMISAQNYDCDFTNIVIQFRTKPQRSAVRQPEPAIQDWSPVVALGERFRFEPGVPLVVDAPVFDGQTDVAPEPLNANGIHFEFDEPIRKYEIDLRLHEGASLGWLPRGLVERENMERRIQIMPGEGAPLLDFDTVYEIDIFVQDFQCWTADFKIVFATKPEP